MFSELFALHIVKRRGVTRLLDREGGNINILVFLTYCWTSPTCYVGMHFNNIGRAECSIVTRGRAALKSLKDTQRCQNRNRTGVRCEQ